MILCFPLKESKKAELALLLPLFLPTCTGKSTFHAETLWRLSISSFDVLALFHCHVFWWLDNDFNTQRRSLIRMRLVIVTFDLFLLSLDTNAINNAVEKKPPFDQPIEQKFLFTLNFSAYYCTYFHVLQREFFQPSILWRNIFCCMSLQFYASIH